MNDTTPHGTPLGAQRPSIAVNATMLCLLLLIGVLWRATAQGPTSSISMDASGNVVVCDVIMSDNIQTASSKE